VTATTVTDLRHREVGFTSLYENLHTTTPGGRLVFHVFAASGGPGESHPEFPQRGA
jgi:DNA invertase Pin-like site-specific DNA recombinase